MSIATDDADCHCCSEDWLPDVTPKHGSPAPDQGDRHPHVLTDRSGSVRVKSHEVPIALAVSTPLDHVLTAVVGHDTTRDCRTYALTESPRLEVDAHLRVLVIVPDVFPGAQESIRSVDGGMSDHDRVGCWPDGLDEVLIPTAFPEGGPTCGAKAALQGRVSAGLKFPKRCRQPVATDAVVCIDHRHEGLIGRAVSQTSRSASAQPTGGQHPGTEFRGNLDGPISRSTINDHNLRRIIGRDTGEALCNVGLFIQGDDLNRDWMRHVPILGPHSWAATKPEPCSQGSHHDQEGVVAEIQPAVLDVSQGSDEVGREDCRTQGEAVICRTK